PDHVKVHAVTRRAAELAGTPRYLEGSMNRDAMIRSHQAAVAAGLDVGEWDPSQPMDDGNPLGSLESELHWACDVSEFLEVKRSALKAHASQSDAQGMLQMPEAWFAAAFSWEHYIEPGRPDGMVTGWFLDEETVR
ncbi:MAG: GlcNAc-PI de-N-acetylase, partial [Terrabacter sp.]